MSKDLSIPNKISEQKQKITIESHNIDLSTSAVKAGKSVLSFLPSSSLSKYERNIQQELVEISKFIQCSKKGTLLDVYWYLHDIQLKCLNTELIGSIDNMIEYIDKHLYQRILDLLGLSQQSLI